ncbi:MAG TPA: ATP synthase F1 subunit gamma [Prolixibacteraceae bacterium]|nr:ATP synthase F1 subunit gamma [Prolixibacteraceae bacterium]
MANLKEMRLRIVSVKSTQQVTRAMKMVSAAKLRKAQDAIIQIRPYAEKLHDILVSLVDQKDASEFENKYAEHKETNKILIVAITSNRGLCGGFNSNVVKKVEELLNTDYESYYQRGAVDILAIGKKGVDGLKAKNIMVSGTIHQLYDNLQYSSAEEVALNLMNSFSNGEYDRIDLVYNQFKNAAIQKLMVEQFLPVEIAEETEVSTDSHHYINNYIFEPNVAEIMETIIPKSLKIQFYKAILDSVASEHGARMTAMHKATDNASELVRELNLLYNKARQSAITGEILEIVSGANALQSS